MYISGLNLVIFNVLGICEQLHWLIENKEFVKHIIELFRNTI